MLGSSLLPTVNSILLLRRTETWPVGSLAI